MAFGTGSVATRLQPNCGLRFNLIATGLSFAIFHDCPPIAMGCQPSGRQGLQRGATV
jgi:hypothetical protein